MDPANLLHAIYQSYRERRLADVLELLSDEFKLTVSLPDDLPNDRLRARSKAETALLIHGFLDQYDVLEFDPGAIEVVDDVATVRPKVKYRHKKTGRIIDTHYMHAWRIVDGKAAALHQHHNEEQWRIYLESLANAEK